MDITSSEVSYLGYPAPESYGLNWKVRGSTPGIYDAVGVFGDVTNSHVHHNYFGFFTFGAEAMRFAGNEVDHNVVYGIDPHDDSDRLLIENNFVHHNGTHGIICSKRCDHLVIRNNRSVNNGGNGIMLHSQVTDSLVEKNTATGNGDAGVALFESHNNTVRSNKLSNNAVGIRLSVGSANNRVEQNTMSSNSKYGVYLYQGTDTPVGGVGRPHHNQFLSNTISKSGSFAVRIVDADDNTFKRNRYSQNRSGASVEGGLRNKLDL
jgi:parallel beta-helix repeat protein